MRVVAKRSAELAALHAEIFGSRSANALQTATSRKVVESGDRDGLRTTDYTDDEVIRSACRAANGENFFRLYRGDWQSTYSSQSQADLALCAMLSFWTQSDVDRIDRLFRRSGLMRGKWNRRDYRDRTIQRAIESTSQNCQTHVDVQCGALPVQLESLM
jgi:putative DNA primase/helicase